MGSRDSSRHGATHWSATLVGAFPRRGGGPMADLSATRSAALEMSPDDFREAGHRAGEAVADLRASLQRRPVTRDEPPAALRALLPAAVPGAGTPAGELLRETASLLVEHS